MKERDKIILEKIKYYAEQTVQFTEDAINGDEIMLVQRTNMLSLNFMTKFISKSKKGEKLDVKDHKSLAKFAKKIELEDFSHDVKTVSACVFNLSQIGELATRLSEDFIKETHNIPWQKIKGLRNRIVHDYEGIRLNIIWDVIKDFLPELIENIGKLLLNGESKDD